jgi:hypothetical protein
VNPSETINELLQQGKRLSLLLSDGRNIVYGRVGDWQPGVGIWLIHDRQLPVLYTWAHIISVHEVPEEMYEQKVRGL